MSEHDEGIVEIDRCGSGIRTSNDERLDGFSLLSSMTTASRAGGQRLVDLSLTHDTYLPRMARLG